MGCFELSVTSHYLFTDEGEIITAYTYILHPMGWDRLRRMEEKNR